MRKKNNPEIKNKLSSAVVTGTSWLSLFQLIDIAIGFLRLIIIARILSPHDFGLIGIALLLTQILNTFSQTGIQQYIVHKTDYLKFLNPGWTYLLLRGIVLYIILFFSAPFISLFFNNPSATDVIRIVGITLIFDGLANIGIVLFQKNMIFNKQFIYQFFGNFTDFVVALILAILFQNVWALVAGIVANSFVRFVLSYVLSNYRPKFDLNINLLKEMNHYGKWIFGSNILQFLYSQGDDIIVGRLLGTVSLGYYQLAYRISNLPATQITHIISNIMFPAYSSIQKDINKLSMIYIKSLQITTFLSLFIGIIIILYAYPFTYIILGKQWLPIVTSMQILTIWGVLRSIGATTGPIWQAVGKPKSIAYIQSIQTITLFILIVPLTINWGINGTSVAVVLSSIIPNALALIYISKTLNVNKKLIFKELYYPIFAVFITCIVYLITNQIMREMNLLNFFINSFFSLFAYLFTIYIMHKYFNYDILLNISKLLPTMKFLKKI